MLTTSSDVVEAPSNSAQEATSEDPGLRPKPLGRPVTEEVESNYQGADSPFRVQDRVSRIADRSKTVGTVIDVTRFGDRFKLLIDWEDGECDLAYSYEVERAP